MTRGTHMDWEGGVANGYAGPDAEVGFENGRTVAAVHDNDAAALLTKRMSDWGESEAKALENLEWFQEAAGCLLASGAPAAKGANGLLVEKLFDIFGKVLAIMARPVSEKEKIYLVRMILWRMDQPILDDLNGGETPADWYRPMGISKEMAYRTANQLGDELGLPRRGDQRKPDAREKMSQARLKKKVCS